MPLPTGNMGGVELQENIELEKIRDRKKIKSVWQIARETVESNYQSVDVNAVYDGTETDVV